MEGMLSPADVAVLSGNHGNNGSNGGFGDMGAWWVIIFLIFAFGGWGGRGFGGNGSNGSSGNGALDNYVLASDFAQLSRQLDNNFSNLNNAITTVNEGLCNGFYQELVNTNTINSNISNSTASLQSTLCQGFNGINTNMMNGNFALQNAINGIGSQIASCCCDVREAISGVNSNIQNVNYNMAMNTNTLQNAMCLNTRDIVSSQEAGTRAILDAITANRIEDKNAQIQAQQNEINALRLSASQAQQNEYLLNSLRNGCPVNAQLVCGNQPIPVQYIGAYGNGYGYNNGCGCGC